MSEHEPADDSNEDRTSEPDASWNRGRVDTAKAGVSRQSDLTIDNGEWELSLAFEPVMVELAFDGVGQLCHEIGVELPARTEEMAPDFESGY